MIIKKLSVLGLYLATATGLLLASCTKNDETTIVPIGTEYYIDDILSAIPDTLHNEFLAAFGNVPSGAIPPKIDGSYVVDPKQRVGSNLDGWPINTIEPNVYLRFEKQHNGIVYMDLNETTETVTDTVFVCGDGNNFAVYFVESKDYEIGWMKRGVIMKGKVTGEGLSEFRYATIVMETEDHSGGQFGLYTPGTYFIYKDGDGMAENLDW